MLESKFYYRKRNDVGHNAILCGDGILYNCNTVSVIIGGNTV